MNQPDDADSIDAQLAGILEDLFARIEAGERVDIEAVASEHPDLADELRSLWATAQVATEFSSLDDEDRSTTSDGPASAPLALPARVADYELLEEIGRGGMGVVYRARQISLGRTVAVKMILRGDWASGVDVARFRTEAESAARLDHPHIVPVYEVGEHEGLPFFSMRLIEGKTLSEQLREGPLPPREAAELLMPVCRAIEAAHQHGILHRDLKPSNILIDDDRSAYVTDFGLAKRVTHNVDPADDSLANLTGTGAVLGTPGYMAPEQAAGRRGEISQLSDVYSLGAVLYAMLTGRAPFQSASPVDTMLMVLEQDPVPPRLLNPAADADLEMIALKCLQKPPDLRYTTAGKLADDLQAFLDDEPVSARSSHFTQVLSRAFRETHHAGVLENWGVLWMWHSLVLLALCLVTNWLQWRDQAIPKPARWPYLALWVVGLGVWAMIFWNLRKRSGPVTFVERQVAHVWAGSMTGSMLVFALEAVLDKRVLELSPVLGVISGMVFLVKAGILSGRFYVQAGVLFLTGLAMAVLQNAAPPGSGRIDFSISLFGLVSAGCFFFPGLKYFRRQRAHRPPAARPGP